MDRISADIDIPRQEKARVNYKVLWQEIRVVGYSGGYRNIRGNTYEHKPWELCDCNIYNTCVEKDKPKAPKRPNDTNYKQE